jgi:hypothetical protein
MSFGVSFQLASSALIDGEGVSAADGAEGDFAVVVDGCGVSFVVTVASGLSIIPWRV